MGPPVLISESWYKREDRAGEARLRELEQELTKLRQTVLRISGAIQVLEELLGEENPAETAIERI
jgi:hypothetical protein